MPELPEVETVVRGLQARLAGRRLARVEIRRPDLRFPFPKDFAGRLQGRRVERIGRRAKYILAEFDDGTVWITHLGVAGHMTVTDATPPAPGAHDHVLIETDDRQHLRYTDARRFGFMEITTADAVATHPRLAALGLEPLPGNGSSGLGGPELARLLRGRATTIKAALLDQRLVAGLGNIYACEALFRAGLSPRRRAGSVANGRAARLAVAIRETLEDAIAAGGSSLRDYVQASGELGWFQHRWAVYGREGEACPACDCDRSRSGGIRRIVQAGRSTFYCPRRQR